VSIESWKWRGNVEAVGAEVGWDLRPSWYLTVVIFAADQTEICQSDQNKIDILRNGFMNESLIEDSSRSLHGCLAYHDFTFSLVGQLLSCSTLRPSTTTFSFILKYTLSVLCNKRYTFHSLPSTTRSNYDTSISILLHYADTKTQDIRINSTTIALSSNYFFLSSGAQQIARKLVAISCNSQNVGPQHHSISTATCLRTLLLSDSIVRLETQRILA
jgi:hypothetical protein